MLVNLYLSSLNLLDVIVLHQSHSVCYRGILNLPFLQKLLNQINMQLQSVSQLPLYKLTTSQFMLQRLFKILEVPYNE